MIKLPYKATATEQIHTGADESHGTTKLLRREKRRLLNDIAIKSNFNNDDERRNAIVNILLAVYKSIDSDLKASNYGFYDAFSSKVLASTGVKNRYEFLTALCKSCGVRVIDGSSSKDVIDLIDLFNDFELLDTIRNENQYIMLMLRYCVQEKTKPNAFDSIGSSIFKKSFDWIPYVSGNSIRGIMRRLCMRDFLTRIGVDGIEYGVDKDMYHQLMTGGNITSSTAYEDIEQREKYIRLCPLISLFGSAIGNMTIQGKMKVGALRPMCNEHGNADVSFWETISREFGTRLDSSKTEVDLKIVSEMSSEQKSQMKYEFEVFNKGTLFSGFFALNSKDELVVSAFWYCLHLLKEHGYIGGNSARGYGGIDFNIDIPNNATDKYIKYIESIKSDSLDFFGVKRVVK